MRQNDTPHVAVTLAADQLRRLVMWTHAALGAAALFIYLYTRLGHLPWLNPFASIRLIVIAAPVLLPYAISARNCWQLDAWQRGNGPDRLRVASFMAVLIAGGVLIDATLLGTFGQVERLILIGLLVAQATVYFHAAEQMLDGGF
jgi:hypothetical protein